MKETRRSAWGLLVLAMLALSLASRTALAARRTVVHVEGSVPWMNASVGADVRSTLPASLVSSPSARFEADLRAHPRGWLRHSLLTDYGRLATADEVRRALSRSDRDLAVLVDYDSNSRGKPFVRVLVIGTARHDPLLFRVEGLPLTRSRRAKLLFWTALLEAALAEHHETPEPPAETAEPVPSMPAQSQSQTEPAKPPPEPEPAEPKPQPARPSDLTARDSSRQTAPESASPEPLSAWRWHLSAAFETSLRHFEHEAAAPATGRSYQAWPVPGFRIAGEAYPFGERIGLDLSYARSLGVRSTTFVGDTVGTTASRFDIALKARWFTAHREHAPSVALLLGYEYDEFAFASAPADREVPAARYHIARAGAEARLPIDRFVLFVAAEYGRLVSIGPLGDVTASGGGNGVAFRFGTQIELLPWLLVGVEGRYARMGFELNRELAKTILDQYFTVGVGPDLVF